MYPCIRRSFRWWLSRDFSFALFLCLGFIFFVRCSRVVVSCFFISLSIFCLVLLFCLSGSSGMFIISLIAFISPFLLYEGMPA